MRNREYYGRATVAAVAGFSIGCFKASSESEHVRIYSELFTVRDLLYEELGSTFSCQDAIKFLYDQSQELEGMNLEGGRWILNKDCDSQLDWVLASAKSTVLDDFESVWIITRGADIRSVSVDVLTDKVRKSGVVIVLESK